MIVGGADDIDEHGLVCTTAFHGFSQGGRIHLSTRIEGPLHRLAEVSAQLLVQIFLQILKFYSNHFIYLYSLK